MINVKLKGHYKLRRTKCDNIILCKYMLNFDMHMWICAKGEFVKLCKSKCANMNMCWTWICEHILKINMWNCIKDIFVK